MYDTIGGRSRTCLDFPYFSSDSAASALPTLLPSTCKHWFAVHNSLTVLRTSFSTSPNSLGSAFPSIPTLISVVHSCLLVSSTSVYVLVVILPSTTGLLGTCHWYSLCFIGTLFPLINASLSVLVVVLSSYSVSLWILNSTVLFLVVNRNTVSCINLYSVHIVTPIILFLSNVGHWFK